MNLSRALGHPDESLVMSWPLEKWYRWRAWFELKGRNDGNQG